MAPDPIAALPTCGGQPPHEFADTLVVPCNDLAALEQAFADHPGTYNGNPVNLAAGTATIWDQRASW